MTKTKASKTTSPKPTETTRETKPVARTKPAPKPVPKGVPIQELGIGQRFELHGELFQVKEVVEGVTRTDKLEWSPDGTFMVSKWVQPVAHNTLVIPQQS